MISSLCRLRTSALPCLLILAAVSSPPAAGEERGGPPRYVETLDDPPAAVTARENPAARSPGLRVRVGSFVSVQVNLDGAGMNILGDAANEPSIAVNPTDPDNLVIGWRQFDSAQSNFRQAGWAFSFDGGETWTFAGVLEPGVFRSDPVLDADSLGNLFYYSLQEDFSTQFFKSLTGGVSWLEPVEAFGGDKNWMVVDRSGGIGDGNVYAAWQRFFNCCDDLTFTRSTDGAGSFETPVAVPNSPSFGTLAVGPDGEVYETGVRSTFFQDFDTFVIARSDDARNPALTPTFSGTVVDMGGSMVGFTGPNPEGLAGQANVAVDTSDGPDHGTVYMLASVDPPGSDPMDVHVVRSTDGGETWSAPVRVNDDPPASSSWQWFGAFAVASNGRLDAVWNDTRGSGQVNLSETFYAYSWDGGASWSENIPLTPVWDSFVGWPNQNKIGDYYDMVSDETGAHLAYATTLNGEQDVYHVRLFPDCNGNGVSDVVDIQDGTSDDADGNHVPDECEDGFLLAPPDPGIAGELNTFSLSGGTPGDTVLVVASRNRGSTPVGGCPGTELEVANPRLMGTATVAGDGTASVSRALPAGLGGETLFFQAVQRPTCTVTNLVTSVLR